MTAVPFQRPGLPESVGLSPVQCAQAVWAVGSDGTSHRGAAAILAALSQAMGAPSLMLLYTLPGLRQTFDVAYALIARARGRLPGTIPYCKTHRDQC